jgi:hypothetical protein
VGALAEVALWAIGGCSLSDQWDYACFLPLLEGGLGAASLDVGLGVGFDLGSGSVWIPLGRDLSGFGALERLLWS